jgi:DNA-binding transcriptional MerR regulator
MFTIGGFARLAGVSPKVLRSWDAAALFAPAWVDPATGYRYYSPAQLPTVRRVLALRDVGVSRAEIAELVRGDADLRTTLKRRRAALEAERRELERRLAALEIRVGGAADTDVVIRRLDPEPVATFELRNAPGDEIGAAFHELESHVRDVGIRAARPPGAIPDEDVIFVPVRRLGSGTDRIGFRRLPPARAATILHRGAYASLPEAIEMLARWVAAAGHERVGSLRILYLQFGAEADLRLPHGWTVEDDADYVTELQLPIGAE